jgi:hypothetical protein
MSGWTEKNQENLNQDSQCPDKVSNQVLPECKSRAQH